MIALSVDPVRDSQRMIRRLKLSYIVASDQDQQVMQAYGVQNPDTQELALHAVFIVDEARRVFYRKVASRRPLSQELLDAVDHRVGRYPMNDLEVVTEDFQREFPTNYFQALIEIATNSELTDQVSSEGLSEIILLLKTGRSDDSVIAFRQFIAEYQTSLSREDLFATAAWLTKQALEIDADALQAGSALSAVLTRLGDSRSRLGSSKEIGVLQQELNEVRSRIRANASRWKLDYAKSMLRIYRKLAIAGIS